MKTDFGGVTEEVVTSDEFPLDKARAVLDGETIAVIGYGVQGPAQAMNMRDNGLDVIVGQEPSIERDWEKAKTDGWVPGKNLFLIQDAVKKGTIIQFLVSDAAQKIVWPTHVAPFLARGNALYFSHGFSIVFGDQTGVVPSKEVDVIMVAPKGAGSSVRTNFLNKSGINSSFAVKQDGTGRARDRTLALGIGIGSGYLFETTFRNEVLSDLVGERAILLGGLCALAQASYYALLSRDFDHNPQEAFRGSSEQLTQVLIPLIGRLGVDEIYKQAKDLGQLGTVKLYQDAARKALTPLMERLYKSVETGRETAVVLRENSAPDYRERLDAELKMLDNSFMWRAGAILRTARPKRDYGGNIKNFALAGVLIGAIEAQYETLIRHGHSPSEAANETVEELTQSLNPIYQRDGVAALIGKCSTTAQRGALDWMPVFQDALLPVFAGNPPFYENLDEFAPQHNHYAGSGPNIWEVMEAVRSLRPENRKK
jgi:ketol-acid reductoisomerase